VTYEDAQRKVHDAIGGLLREGEIAVGWTLTIDVAGPDDGRYLAHRAGGGIDGSSSPMAWTALGMLRAGAACAQQQLLEATVDHEDDEDDS
jgi:hypothetical protein